MIYFSIVCCFEAKILICFVLYMIQIIKEIETRCQKIIGMIDKHLIPTVHQGERPDEARVFYYKM